MTELVEKAVFLDDFTRVQNVIALLERLYSRDVWQGGILFVVSGGGFLLVVTFDLELYRNAGPFFETLFPERDLRSVTLAEACAERRRYQPWLSGDIATTLRTMRLLPGRRVLDVDPSVAPGSSAPAAGSE